MRTGADGIRFAKRDERFRRRSRTDGAPPMPARTCCWPSGADPTPTTSGSTRPGSPPTRRGYIVVDDQLRTNVTGIWALGDCNGRGAFTHTAYNDFEIVAANLLDGEPRQVSDRIPAYALYIDPPLGRAGLTETQVRARAEGAGRQAADDARWPRDRKGRDQGFMKVVVDAETEDPRRRDPRRRRRRGDPRHPRHHGRQGALHRVARTMHIHPTVSELVPTVLQELKPLD